MCEALLKNEKPEKAVKIPSVSDLFKTINDLNPYNSTIFDRFSHLT